MQKISYFQDDLILSITKVLSLSFEERYSLFRSDPSLIMEMFNNAEVFCWVQARHLGILVHRRTAHSLPLY